MAVHQLSDKVVPLNLVAMSQDSEVVEQLQDLVSRQIIISSKVNQDFSGRNLSRQLSVRQLEGSVRNPSRVKLFPCTIRQILISR